MPMRGSRCGGRVTTDDDVLDWNDDVVDWKTWITK